MSKLLHAILMAGAAMADQQAGAPAAALTHESLLRALESKMNHHGQQTVALSVPVFTRMEFAQVFLGMAEGFGVSLVEGCLEDSLNFSKDTAGAIEKFMSKDSTAIKEGLRTLGLAIVHIFPKALKDCGGTEQEVVKLVKALSVFTSPDAFAYHVGHDLIINGKDIFKTLNSSINAWKKHKYHDFGFAIGTILKDLILSTEVMKHALVEEFPSSDKAPVTTALPAATAVSHHHSSTAPLSHPVETLLEYPSGELRFRVKTQGSSFSGFIPSPSDAVVFTQGVFEGFGEDLPKDCVVADGVLGHLLDAAFRALEKGTPAGIALAIEILTRAFKMELPKVEHACGPTVADAVNKIDSALSQFHTPHELFIGIAHNVEINRVQIRGELLGFLAAMKGGRFETAGEEVGKILKQIVIGTEALVRGDAEKKVTSNQVESTSTSNNNKGFFDMAKSIFV